jgi:hypothetical protein
MEILLLTYTYLLTSFLVFCSYIKIPRLLSKPLDLLLVFMIIAFYLYFMFRIDGVDFNNYVDYFNFPELIGDSGFRGAVYIANWLLIDFTFFLLLQALFTIWAIKNLSKAFNADFMIAFSIFIIHSAIIRDFSQSRVALAVAFLFMAYASSNKFKKIILYIVAVSMHLSAAFPIILFYLCDKLASLSKIKIVIIILIFTVLAILFKGQLVQSIIFIDPRVEIYLNWSEDFYGNPVNSYQSLLFNTLIYFLALLSYISTKDIKYLKFSLYVLFGIITFYAFSDVAIFSYRLSSLSIIFYPFIISKIYIDQKKYYYLQMHYRKVILLRFALIISAFAVFLAGSRSGNLDVLNFIVPYVDF